MMTRFAALFTLLSTVVTVHAENVLAESRRAQYLPDAHGSPDPVDDMNSGGCFPIDGGNGECSGLKEGHCRLDSDCEWVSSCPKAADERPTNLFEQPDGKHYCWLIRDEGKSKDDAKNKGACSSEECKLQCSRAYRRSPRGNKADLCYWDPAKEKCHRGDRFVVEPECPFLPAASKSGCFPVDGSNSECSGLKEGQCRLDSDCEWFSSCPKTADERPTNLFEQPEGKDHCWLITDVGKSKADKRKGSCTSDECKLQCSRSYRRSPRGNKARLCYWDPAKEKCQGGDRLVVEESQCPFLPAASQGGCFPRDGGNGECSGLKEGQCRLDSDCEWESSCPKAADERPTNLFEQPEGKHYCWLIRDEGKSKDDAKNKGACSSEECKLQCSGSYRRSPRGNKARLCYWDPAKEKCKGGDHFVVEPQCPFLPIPSIR